MALSSLIAILTPGERIFLPGSGGEPPGVVQALYADTAPALDITSTFIPGVNSIELGRLQPGSRFTGLFAQATHTGQVRCQFRQLSQSYAAFAKHLNERERFDTCIVHVSPPDDRGRCWLGPSVEFTEIAARRSKRIIAVINPQLPPMRHSVSFAFSSFAATAEMDAPLREYGFGTPSAQAAAIAKHVAPFIEDGSTIQVGIGKVPDALMRLLAGRRGLKLFSGMLSDGARILAEKGALDSSFRHTACVYLGSQDFYGWLADRDDFSVAGCDTTHSVMRLAALPRFVAINSALSVDLLGQANIEMVDDRMISGVGGAPDFARGATLSPGGISIVALPSTGGSNGVSRIVPSLDGPCSLPRYDIDVIVTEHGAADLRAASFRTRAERIIGVAAPQHRPQLEAALATFQI